MLDSWLVAALKSVYYRTCLVCEAGLSAVQNLDVRPAHFVFSHSAIFSLAKVNNIGTEYLLLCGECCDHELRSEKKIRDRTDLLPELRGKSVRCTESGSLPFSRSLTAACLRSRSKKEPR